MDNYNNLDNDKELTKADGFENGPSAKMQGTPKSLPFGIRIQFQPNT